MAPGLAPAGLRASPGLSGDNSSPCDRPTSLSRDPQAESSQGVRAMSTLTAGPRWPADRSVRNLPGAADLYAAVNVAEFDLRPSVTQRPVEPVPDEVASYRQTKIVTDAARHGAGVQSDAGVGGKSHVNAAIH